MHTKSILKLYIHVCQEKGCIYRFKHFLLMFKTKFFSFGIFIQFDPNEALIINNAYYVGIIIESLLWHINQRVRLHNLLGSLVLTSTWDRKAGFSWLCFFDVLHAACLAHKTTLPRKYTHEISPLSFLSLKVSVYSETK